MLKNILLFLAFLPFQLLSQNLIPNGNFEDKNGCPTSQGQYRLAEEWMSPNQGTPDYFNDCSGSLGFGTEFNCKGGQVAHSGHGYMGFISENLNHNRYNEYLETRLKAPMIEGQSYCIRMYVSPGEGSCSLHELGVVFSQAPLKDLEAKFIRLPFTPVSNGTVLSDTRNWMCIKGNYIAKGGESYLILGDFGEDTNFVFAKNNPDPDSPFKSAYYFVDDVSVVALPEMDCGCIEGN